MTRIATAALAGALLLIPATGRSQTVLGTVVERGTGRPLAGAFVVLVGEDGRRHNGVLAGDDGSYTLHAARPGRYRLTAERIGYAGAETDLLDLLPGPAMRLDIEVPVRAVTLEGIRAEVGERCRPRPGSGPATARLWEEARKALEVTRWSQSRGVLRMRIVEHRRELDAATYRPTAEEEIPKTGFFDSSPYRSVPAERLERGGYVQRDSMGRYDYFAPDADVLLSDEFLRTHCFRVQEPPADEPELVGLAFDPLPERDLPDITGVLWLERGTAELRRLDFTYRRLPFRHGDWPQVGGRVVFERLATGPWIVRRWRIRMPMAAEPAGRFGARAAELVLTALMEEGAEVVGAWTRDGRKLPLRR